MKITFNSLVSFRHLRLVNRAIGVGITNLISFKHKLVKPLFTRMDSITSAITFKHKRMNRLEFETSIGSQISFKHTIYV